MQPKTKHAVISVVVFLFLLTGCAPRPRFTDSSHHRVQSKQLKKKASRFPIEKLKVGSSWTGVASYYGKKFHGRKTSNGETYNMYGMTAAHKSLPFGTKLEVVNLSNRKRVIVRINDRGPFIQGRELDLSQGAAKRIDMIAAGVQEVKMTIISLGAP